jgi:hypothetical protein
MIETMIEEVQNLHIRIHGESIELEEIKEKYKCKLTTSSLLNIKQELILLHHSLLFEHVGLADLNDL